MASYETPEGVHECMHLGRYTLHRHDYDGSIVTVVDEEGGKPGDRTGFHVHARELEAAIGKLSCSNPPS